MPNIAMLTGPWTAQKDEVMRGVYDFAQSLHDWNLLKIEEPIALAIRTAHSWRADSLICLNGNGTHELVSLHNSQLPHVTVAHYLSSPAASTNAAVVSINPSSLAQLIVQHLQNIKYERVLWVWQTPAQRIRQALAEVFEGRLSEIALRTDAQQLRSIDPEPNGELVEWFRNQPSTLVLAEGEEVAVYIRRLARRLEWKVPHDVGLISLCDGLSLALPSLSITSVVQPFRELGYQAARLTHRLLSGQPVPSDGVSVEVLNMTCRASSIESGQDLAIERAVRFIKENATRGITVSEVMAFQQTSRVTFERQFQLSMGCTPGDYIRRIKVEKACQLLTGSQQSIESIGKTCGYLSPAKFSSFFKRAMQMSPAAYRRHSRQGQDDIG